MAFVAPEAAEQGGRRRCDRCPAASARQRSARSRTSRRRVGHHGDGLRRQAHGRPAGRGPAAADLLRSMTDACVQPGPGSRIDELVAIRTEASARFFEAEAPRLAELCHVMAERFARKGRLLALGASPQARSDARHVAVEFVHPVIVGKRALPAIGLAGEGGSLTRQVELLAEPEDIVIGFGDDAPFLLCPTRRATRADVARGLERCARERGCLTMAFEPGPAEWVFEPHAEDPFVRQEVVETAYHLLWELVHVFFDHQGLLKGRDARARARHRSLELPLSVPRAAGDTTWTPVLADVKASVLLKAEEISALQGPDAARQPGGDRGGRGGAARRARPRRAHARARKRRLGHRCDGRRRRHALPTPRVAAAARARPHRGHLDHHRDRQRHRHGRDLHAAGDRPRPGRRRAAGDVHQRQLEERDRGARGGTPALAHRRWRWSATTAARWRRSGSPTMSWSPDRSTSRGSRRRRPAPGTRSAS